MEVSPTRKLHRLFYIASLFVYTNVENSSNERYNDQCGTKFDMVQFQRTANVSEHGGFPRTNFTVCFVSRLFSSIRTLKLRGGHQTRGTLATPAIRLCLMWSQIRHGPISTEKNVSEYGGCTPPRHEEKEPNFGPKIEVIITTGVPWSLWTCLASLNCQF